MPQYCLVALRPFSRNSINYYTYMEEFSQAFFGNFSKEFLFYTYLLDNAQNIFISRFRKFLSKVQKSILLDLRQRETP